MNVKDANSSHKNIEELIKIVAKLRHPSCGCPCDKKQTHKSLIKYAIEEAHEVADAINYGNDENLCDELGDLLLQVIFHAQIANEEQRFGLEDIAISATAKILKNLRVRPNSGYKVTDFSKMCQISIKKSGFFDFLKK